MDPHEPFLKAILADRHDDLPRLVYADWLEETGESPNVARAHFIRTQIALESLTAEHSDYQQLKAIEARLLSHFLRNWVCDLPDYLQTNDRVTWRRGFPNVVRVGLGFPDDWGAEIQAKWFDQLPIQGVHIERMWGPGVGGWLHRFNWAVVESLRLGPNLLPLIRDDDEPTLVFLEFMNWPGITVLRHLDLSENRLNDAWLVRFVTLLPKASFASSLTSLDISTNFHITDAGANVLATSPALDRLNSLRIRDTGISPAGLSMLRKRFGTRLA